VFVRCKKVKGNTYYQLVRNYREDGKHRQKVLCHLGRHRSLEAAIAAERELTERHECAAASHSEEAQYFKEVCLEQYAEEIEEMGGISLAADKRICDGERSPMDTHGKTSMSCTPLSTITITIGI